MSILAIIGLSILALIVVIGIFRVIIEPADDIWTFMGHLFLLDILVDILSFIIELIGDID